MGFLLAGTALMGAAEGLGYVDLANPALITKWRLLLQTAAALAATAPADGAAAQGGTDTEKRAPGSIFFFHQICTD